MKRRVPCQAISPAKNTTPAEPSAASRPPLKVSGSMPAAMTMTHKKAVTSHACASMRRRSYHFLKPSRAISLLQLGDDGGMVGRALQAARRLVDGTGGAVLCKLG